MTIYYECCVHCEYVEHAEEHAHLDPCAEGCNDDRPGVPRDIC